MRIWHGHYEWGGKRIQLNPRKGYEPGSSILGYPILSSVTVTTQHGHAPPPHNRATQRRRTLTKRRSYPYSPKRKVTITIMAKNAFLILQICQRRLVTDVFGLCFISARFNRATSFPSSALRWITVAWRRIRLRLGRLSLASVKSTRMSTIITPPCGATVCCMLSVTIRVGHSMDLFAA